MALAEDHRSTVDDGFLVARECISDAAALLADGLISAYLIGSLAHGGFAPAVSDVDICFVVGDADWAGPRLFELMSRSRQHPHPLRQRLSLFWTSEDALLRGRPDGRLPAVDHADLVMHGNLERGREVRSGLTPPSKEELVASTASFVADKWGDDWDWIESMNRVDLLAEQGPRPVTKTSLFPVRFLWTVVTGEFGQVVDAVDWYLSWEHATAHGRALSVAALGWRESGRLDSSVPDLLGAGLAPLWLQLLDELPPHPRISTLVERISAAQ